MFNFPDIQYQYVNFLYCEHLRVWVYTSSDAWSNSFVVVQEKELKQAADAVLSEVRKKQADAKRMLDILKSLEKLRKLRKEAAARKG